MRLVHLLDTPDNELTSEEKVERALLLTANNKWLDYLLNVDIGYDELDY